MSNGSGCRHATSPVLQTSIVWRKRCALTCGICMNDLPNRHRVTRMRGPTNRILAALLLTGFCAASAFALDARAQDLWALVEAGDLQKVQAYLATPGVDINDRYVVGGVYDDPRLLMDDKSLLDFAVEANQLSIAT